jgi:hypothetical protein
MTQDDPRRAGLEAVAKAWWVKIQQETLQLGDSISLGFSRGLLDSLQVIGEQGIRQLRERAQSISKLGPVQHLSVSPDYTKYELGSRALVTTLSVATVRALAELPWIKSLKTLTFRKLRGDGSLIDSASVQAIADFSLAQLEALDLSGNEGIEPVAVQALLQSSYLDRLTTLDLSGSYWQDWDGSVVYVFPNIGLQGVQMLAASPRVARLTTLNLSWNDLGERGVEALLSSPYLEHLSRLSLEDASLSDTGRQALRTRFGDRICFYKRYWRPEDWT